jgi:hypothetical protein
MEFTHDYRVVFEPEPDHPALAGLQPAEQGGYYIRDIFSRYDAALDERSEFSHRHEFVSRLGDTAITNLQRLEALQSIVAAALHHWPSLHQVDPRSLPAH